MIQKRPLGITLIGYFYILGSVVLILSLLLLNNATNQFGIGFRFGLPNVSEKVMKVLVSIISLIMSYGYLKLKKWGYWFMIFYSIYFFVVSFMLSLQYNQQPFIGNMIWSIIVIVYTFKKRKSFNNKIVIE